MSVTLPQSVMDALMPMHVLVGPTGIITHAGPSLKKITPRKSLFGKSFLKVFDVTRPFGVTCFSDIYQHDSCKLRVNTLAGARRTDKLSLRGMALKLPADGAMVVNLSLGISVVEAVQRFDLSAADFAATDPTVDMLYLIEVNNAAFGESKRLNLRLQGAKQQAEAEAMTDALTGLKNRRAMDLVLKNLTNENVPFALMNVDLDYFKAVNDTYGHAAGDLVLESVARVLTNETRETDYVARVGGDEFVVVFENLMELEQLGNIAKRIIAGFEKPVEFEGQLCRVSASIGLTLSSFYDKPKPDRMLGDADAALYKSKQNGRAQHTVFQPTSI